MTDLLAPRLTVVEYANNGDLVWETPQEPPTARHEVEHGTVSQPLDGNTRLVTLFADERAEFAFFPDDAWNEGDALPDTLIWVPIAAQAETTRLVHMGTTMRIAVR
jgi:hypothetical protein